MKLQRFEGVACFSLNAVSDFSTQLVSGVADVKLDKVDKQSVSK